MYTWKHEIINGVRVISQLEKNDSSRIVLNATNLDIEFVEKMIKEHNSAVELAKREGMRLQKNIIIDALDKDRMNWGVTN